MQKSNLIYKFLITVVLMLAVLPAISNAESDPVNVVRSVADQMIAQLKEHKTTLRQNPTLVYSLADRIIVPHADIAEMSRRVLPPRIWNSATAGQKSEFEHEFTSMLVRTYASALAEYTDQTLQFYPVRGGYAGRSDVKVDSVINRSHGPSISVSYRLLLTGSGWRLYDLIVEGVSLIESFRSQFADQLSSGDMSTLIQNMKHHNG